MFIRQTLATGAFLALLGASTVSADVELIAEACADVAVEAPEACAGVLIGAAIAWGLTSIIEGSPANQRAWYIENFIENAFANSPDITIMAIATYQNNPFEHGSGVGQVTGDCTHTHMEIPISGDWGTSQGIEVYTPGPNSNCCVEKWGDGGWTNWGRAGPWSQTTTASGSLMLCHNAPPPPPAPPAPLGQGRYSLDGNDLVTVGGVVGRILTENAPLYSFTGTHSLYKWQNAQSGPYFQAIMQTDGNLVVYYFDNNNVRSARFWTNTGGKKGDFQLVPQEDGNLVIYNSTPGGVRGSAIWQSNTYGITRNGGFVGLVMQQDGNLVMYLFYPDGSCDPIWGADSLAPSGRNLWPH